MWQFYSLGSILAGAFENAVDKAGIVHDGRVDSLVASFYRLLFFFLATLVVALTGLLGVFDFFFHWSFVVLGVIGALSTIMFTHLLRSVEMTAIGATAYLTAFLFLFIDSVVLGISFTTAQLLGITFLVVGGIAFALDGKTRRFRLELTPNVWAMILFIFVFYTAIEAYLFKYLNATDGVNAVSFYANSTIFGCIALFLVLIVKRRVHRLFSPASISYMPYAALGKSFDALNSILYISALSFATVSQVSAFNALLPLVLVAVAWLVQGLFGFRLREHLDSRRLYWKLGAAALLVLGGFLVS